MFPRLVLALVFAVIPFLGLVARSIEGDQLYTLVIRMTATHGGLLQVFLDTGSGYRADQSVGQALQASQEPYDYRLAVPAGAYPSLRIDPGTGQGVYGIERIYVLDPSGAVAAELSLADVEPVNHLALVERSANKLVVECPPGVYDPQLIYRGANPLWLVPSLRSVGSLVRWYFLYVAVGFALLWVAQLAVGRVAPAVSRAVQAGGRAAAAQPHVAVMAAALIATCLAMYPVLFLGRSLVSPNNGAVVMLYDQPPFVAGSSDVVLENSRGADVGAMLWAFIPYSWVQRHALAEGEIPLWNRYSGAGRPLWGQGQSFLLDPLHWLTFLGADPAPGWDLKFAAHRFVFAWGVGVAALVATGAWLPAAVAGSLAPFAGVFAFRLNHPATFTLTYAPWILAAWFLLARATTTRARAWAGLALALASSLVLLSSPPKEAVVMLAMTEATGFLALLLQAGFGPRLLRGLPYAALGGLAMVLVTTPHWLVFLDTLRVSATGYDVPTAFFATLSFAFAMVLGPIPDGLPLPSLHALALPLIVAAVLSPALLWRHRALLACLLGAAASIAIAFGIIPAAVFVRLPLIGNIYSIHFIFLMTSLVPLLIASAAGVDALLHASRARVVILTLGTLVVAMWVFNGMGGVASLARFYGWLMFGVLGGAVLVPLTVFIVTRSFPRVLPLAATAALSLLLVAPGSEHIETGIAPLDMVLLQPRLRADLAAHSPAVDGIHAHRTDPVRVAGVGHVLFPGSQALYDLEGVGGPDALYLKSNDELVTAESTLKMGWTVMFTPPTLPQSATLLDMLNVGYLLARFDEAAAIGPSDRTQELDVIRAIPRATAWPRAFFIDRVGTYTTPADLIAQARAAGHPIAAIQSGDDTAAGMTREVSAGAADAIPATDYRLTTNTTSFRVQAPHAGVVVLGESYMADDFVATLNGQPVPYFRVNHTFKGVAIPGEGEWEVRFEYRPRHWYLALTAAAVGALLLVGLGVVAVRR